MPSRIDASAPAAGSPVVKAELRANLAALRAEVDGMGFHGAAGPTGASALAALKAGIDALEAEVTKREARTAVLESGLFGWPALAADGPADVAGLAGRTALAVAAGARLRHREMIAGGDSDWIGPPLTVAEPLDAVLDLVAGDGVHLYLYKAAGTEKPIPLGSTEGQAGLPKRVTARLKPGETYYRGAYAGAGGVREYRTELRASRPQARAPVVADLAAATVRGAPADLDLLDGASDPIGLALSLAETPTASDRGGTVSAPKADGRTVTYAPPDAFTGTDGFAFRVKNTANLSTVARATIVVSAVAVPSGGSALVYGYNADRDVLVTSWAELKAAYTGGDPKKHIVLKKGTVWSAGHNVLEGHWLGLTKPGTKEFPRVIRAEEKGSVTLGNQVRFVVKADWHRVYGFDWARGQRNDVGFQANSETQHGSHVLVTSCANTLIADMYGEDMASNLGWSHMFSVSDYRGTGKANDNVFKGLTLAHCRRSSGGGQAGTQPNRTTFEDCVFYKCGPQADRNVLVLQFNQGGELWHYPLRDDPSWRNAGQVVRRCWFIGCHGFVSQFKVGGGTYEDCIFVGGGAPNDFDDKDYYNFRMGTGCKIIRTISHNMFSGFDFFNQESEMRDCVIVDPKYTGVRLWRGTRVADSYAPNHGWNESLPSRKNKIINCTFDLRGKRLLDGRDRQSRGVKMGAYGYNSDQGGEAWNQGDYGQNELRNNLWLLATQNDIFANDALAGRNILADNAIGCAEAGWWRADSVPARQQQVIGDVKLQRENRTWQLPRGLGSFTVPIPVPAAGSAAIGAADPAYAAAKDFEGRTRPASGVNCGAIQRVLT